MHDNAPIRFTIGNADTGRRALIIIFEDAFQALDLAQQSHVFKQYIEQLNDDLKNLPDDDPNKAGIRIIAQVCSELAPHLAQADVPLNQPITIELGEAAADQSVDVTHSTKH